MSIASNLQLLLPEHSQHACVKPLLPHESLTVWCTVCVQPEFFQLEDGHSGLLLPIRKKSRRARSGEDEAQSLKAASGTDAKVLAGAVSSFAREGRRMLVTAIGAAAINQAVKAIAIARKNIEEVRPCLHLPASAVPRRFADVL